jgi:hypothetical protein
MGGRDFVDITTIERCVGIVPARLEDGTKKIIIDKETINNVV